MAVAVDTQQRFSEAWETFFRTTRRLRARAGRLPGELSLPQYQVLEALRGTAELSVGELAESAGVAPPTATRMLDCLARDGLVTRRHSEIDRRSVLVSLTADGTAAVERGARDRRRLAPPTCSRASSPRSASRRPVLLERLSQVFEAQL